VGVADWKAAVAGGDVPYPFLVGLRSGQSVGMVDSRAAGKADSVAGGDAVAELARGPPSDLAARRVEAVVTQTEGPSFLLVWWLSSLMSVF
jgi:hypothetical protein